MMRGLLIEQSSRLRGQEGFVLPAAIFALLIMSIVAITALVTTDNERVASRAVRESGAALYAAEAGVNEVWATWPDSLVAGLQPGDSLDLGWPTLDNGASYRAVIRRVDNGGQKVYALLVEGRGAGPLGGQSVVSLGLAASDYELGVCCAGSVTGRGDMVVKDNAWVDGHSTTPSGWGSVCPDSSEHKPGVVWNDTTDIQIQAPGGILGEPPQVQDPLPDSAFQYFNGQTWDELTAMADIVFSGDKIRPQPKVTGGSCDTSVNTNWGSDDPNNPCFDYFPIIYLQGEVKVDADSYGQGVLLVDGGSSTQAGALRLRPDVRFNGIILVKGCLSAKSATGSLITGAIMVDGSVAGPPCGSGDYAEDVTISDDMDVNFSQCAVNRVLEGSTLEAAGAAGVKYEVIRGSWTQRI